jgi:hypothetical protein
MPDAAYQALLNLIGPDQAAGIFSFKKNNPMVLIHGN